MQFNNKTYEELLADMLSGVAGNVLKIEGSIVHDATAPMAMQLAEVYESLNFLIDQTSVSSASAPYLDRLAEQMGVYRISATYAERKGEFYNTENELMDVPIGSRFSIDAINYVVEEKKSLGTFRLMAEESGSAGNVPIGQMQPLTFIEGLKKAMLSDVYVAAADTETDDALRIRYIEYLSSDAQDGNVGQYKKWAAAFPGIGRSKVFPLWNGANTVKVSILTENNEAAASTLVTDFQNYLDPSSLGLGNGVAPIGAKVTVSTATNKTVNIVAQVGLVSEYNLSAVNASIEAALISYFSRNAFNKEKVFYIDVGSVVLNADGVASVSSLTINGGTSNISLGSEEIGKLGTLTVTEAI